MDDPRARLMQKWSSNLPSYDSTYLREGGDEQNGVGVDSHFLGFDLTPLNGKTKSGNKSEKKQKTPMDQKRATEILKKSWETAPHFVSKMLKKAQSLESGGDTQMNNLKTFLVAGIQTVLKDHEGYIDFGQFANSLNALRTSEVKWRAIIHQINPNFRYTPNFVAPRPDASSFESQRYYLNIMTLLKKPIYIACKYVNAKVYQNKDLKKNPFVKKVRHMFRDVRKQIRKYISAYKLTGVPVPPKRVRTQPGDSQTVQKTVLRPSSQPGRVPPYTQPPPPTAGSKPLRPASGGFGRSQLPRA